MRALALVHVAEPRRKPAEHIFEVSQRLIITLRRIETPSPIHAITVVGRGTGHHFVLCLRQIFAAFEGIAGFVPEVFKLLPAFSVAHLIIGQNKGSCTALLLCFRNDRRVLWQKYPRGASEGHAKEEVIIRFALTKHMQQTVFSFAFLDQYTNHQRQCTVLQRFECGSFRHQVFHKREILNLFRFKHFDCRRFAVAFSGQYAFHSQKRHRFFVRHERRKHFAHRVFLLFGLKSFGQRRSIIHLCHVRQDVQPLTDRRVLLQIVVIACFDLLEFSSCSSHMGESRFQLSRQHFLHTAFRRVDGHAETHVEINLVPLCIDDVVSREIGHRQAVEFIAGMAHRRQRAERTLHKIRIIERDHGVAPAAYRHKMSSLEGKIIGSFVFLALKFAFLPFDLHFGKQQLQHRRRLGVGFALHRRFEATIGD